MLFINCKMLHYPEGRLAVLFRFKLFPADIALVEFHPYISRTVHWQVWVSL